MDKIVTCFGTDKLFEVYKYYGIFDSFGLIGVIQSF